MATNLLEGYGLSVLYIVQSANRTWWKFPAQNTIKEGSVSAAYDPEPISPIRAT